MEVLRLITLINKNMDIAKQRNFLLRESVEQPLKITADEPIGEYLSVILFDNENEPSFPITVQKARRAFMTYVMKHLNKNLKNI